MVLAVVPAIKADDGEHAEGRCHSGHGCAKRIRPVTPRFNDMGRIKGHYEWDDNNLTPGRKREGGLHQNLFDTDGNLKGSARFVPDKNDEPQPVYVTETVYVTVEERRRSAEDEALQQAITDLIAQLLDRGLPLAEKWWRERGRPALDARRAKARERRLERKAKKDTAIADTTVVGPSQELAEAAAEQERPRMSSAEAKARYLAALAARAYSDEQMRLVMGANIVDGEGIADLERSLAELPPDQVRKLLEAMATNPTLLQENSLAELASILGRRTLG